MKNNELLAEMKRKEKTQQQMSDDLGITLGTFNKKVNGKNDFTLNEVKTIQKVLGFDNERLLTIFFCR